MNAEHVILVDEEDHTLGVMEKLRAHSEGRLHRAVSVFVFNSKNELLLQKRAPHKYHSGGLWTNTCCSHPRPGENTLVTATRRLREEMGLKCLLQYKTKFLYKARLDNNLTEHELDHIFFGHSDFMPEINKEEACDFRYLALRDIKKDILKNPAAYTEWFKLILEKQII